MKVTSVFFFMTLLVISRNCSAQDEEVEFRKIESTFKLREELGRSAPILDMGLLKLAYSNGGNPKVTGYNALKRKDNGWTLLHECAMQNDVKLAKRLIDSNLVELNALNKNHASPLIIAACYKNWDMFLMLSKYDSIKKDIRTQRTSKRAENFIDYDDMQEIIALDKDKARIATEKLKRILSIETNFPDSKIVEEITNCLADGAPIRTKGDDSTTVLHIAGYFNDKALIRQSVSEGISPNSKTKSLGWTPLMCSAEGDAFEASYYLLNNLKVDVLAKDNKQNTALCHALNSKKILPLIRKYHDDALYLKHRDDIGKYKRKGGSCSNSLRIGHRKNSTIKNIYIAAAEGDTSMAGSILQTDKNCINRYTYVDANKNTAVNAFTIAILSNKYNMVEFLINNNATPTKLCGAFTLWDIALTDSMRRLLKKHGIVSFREEKIKCN